MKKMAVSLGVSLVFIISSATTYAQDEAAAESQAPGVETEAQKPAESAAASEASKGAVARGIFTSDVQNHEPVDQLTNATTDTGTVLFFTELKDFQGETVTHRWEYNGESMAEVKFQVGGPRWRVWSSKNMMPEWVGTWTVSVVNGSGKVVDSETLTYAAAPAMEAAASATPAESTKEAGTMAVTDNVTMEADAEPSESAQ